MGPATALATSPGPVEPDDVRELAPVDWIEPAHVGTDRHGLADDHRSGRFAGRASLGFGELVGVECHTAHASPAGDPLVGIIIVEDVAQLQEHAENHRPVILEPVDQPGLLDQSAELDQLPGAVAPGDHPRSPIGADEGCLTGRDRPFAARQQLRREPQPPLEFLPPASLLRSPQSRFRCRRQG